MIRLFTLIAITLAVVCGDMVAQQELANPLVPAKGRPRVYVGPVIGYNRSLHASGFQSVAGDVLCPDFTAGSGNGYYFGGSFEYLLGSPKDSKSSIIIKALYNYLPAFYEQPGDRLPSLDANGDVVISSVRHVAEIEYSTVNLEALYKLNLFDSDFGIVVGPDIGFVVSASREQRMELVEPLEAVFDPKLFPGEEDKYINGGRAIITARR